MLREGLKTFLGRGKMRCSQGVLGCRLFPIWADPFSFNDTVDLTLGEYFWSFNSCFLTPIGKQEGLRPAKWIYI